MIRLSEREARCEIFTHREGLLAAVGHDLRLEVSHFEVALEESPFSVRGVFHLASIVVRCAVVHGHDAPDVLSDKDRREIEENARRSLSVDAHPEATYEASQISGAISAPMLMGDLTLAGQRRPLVVSVTREGDFWVGRASVPMTAFGLKPVTAVLGTLRVRPEVDVVIRVPASSVSPSLGT